MTVPQPLVARRFDGALLCALLVNLGGAVPFGLTDTSEGVGNATGWEYVVSAVLLVAAIGLALAWWLADRPWLVQWAVRLGGGAWVAYSVAVFSLGELDVSTRIGLALILGGIGLAQLVFASRLERRATR